MNLWEIMMKIKCELNGHMCILPNSIAQFIVNATLMYCNTIDSYGNPRIQPIIFINETGKCNLSFLVRKKSMLAKIIQRNPNIALSTDKTHPTDPSQNTGIMIEAFSQKIISQEGVKECFDNLQKKYSVDVVILKYRFFR
jgi:general stress protein 26